MFKEIKQELAQKYKQLELDQNEIMQKLQAYKETAQNLNVDNTSLLIDDVQNSSLLLLSNTQRDITDKTIIELKKALEECERDRLNKIEQINELKKLNQKLYEELNVAKNNNIKTNKLLNNITMQKEELLNQINMIKKHKSIDSSFYQTSITDITNQDISIQMNRKKSMSQYETTDQKQLKQYKKFTDCVKDMILKLQPKLYDNQNVSLSDAWKWLKIIINDYVQIANTIKQLKQILNVEQPYIVLEVQQLINMIVYKQ
ncbi:unnamed protein product [Paramecium primaurelia]|uniref:Uncharacterized protein n=1 Tax=Paramecium primaurelia TaxID=5886 RepID=A0A8S1PLM2_PARPR|nr:unnamed protein product [Paramecium primaurelia]